MPIHQQYLQQLPIQNNQKLFFRIRQGIYSTTEKIVLYFDFEDRGKKDFLGKLN